MSAAAPGKMVVPNFRSSRLLGIFNVLFATALLLAGLCLGGYAAMLPLWSAFIGQTQAQMKTRIEATRKAELTEIADKEKEAKTDREKDELAARRKEIESRPDATSAMLNIQGMAFSPTLIAYSWTDILTGLALNLMMLASGIGLLHWRPWGRSLGIWTGCLKILRLALLYSFFILVIVPPWAKNMADMVTKMFTTMGQPTAGPMGDPKFVAWIYTVSYSGFAVGVMIFGAIYPAIQLWILTRPGVKAACSGRLKLPKEPGQTWVTS